MIQGGYFPFGQERTNVSPANPGNDQEKFASYTRDSATGLDYANQRYYNALIGRFMRPDPFGGSASANVPQSWNRYAYVGNDPANNFDPEGLDDVTSPGDYLDLYSAGGLTGCSFCGGTLPNLPDGSGVSDPVYTPSAGVPTFTASSCAYCSANPVTQAMVQLNTVAAAAAPVINQTAPTCWQ